MRATVKKQPDQRDYAGVAFEYARRAAADTKGREFCKWVRLAAQRHLDDLKRASRGWEYRFDEWHANDVCDFIEKLPHVEGSWDTKTIRLEPAQVFILAVIFGWRRNADGKRRFSAAYIEMARKGAKSTITAGVALYCLCCEGEVGPQVVIGATTGEQAGKVFKPAQKMVNATPDLREAFEVEAWSRSISCGRNGGFIQPINAKGKTQDGWNPHLGILDELHAHKDRALYDVIKSAFGARRNPLMWVITTAGYDTSGVCYEQRLYVTKILERVLEAEHYFGVIYTLDEADDPFDEAVWCKSNPMIGITPTLASMRTEAADAKASPASEGEFKTKRLNLWLNAASGWLNMAAWNRCADPTLTWDDFDGLDCWIGADLADVDDITALVLSAFDKDGRLLWKPVFYLPEAVLKPGPGTREDRIAVYRGWHQQGHLRLTEGDWVDHNIVEKQIRDWIDRYGARKVTFDQFAAARGMAVRLNESYSGPDGKPIAEVMPKNAKNMADPAKELEARVKSGIERFRHDGNPVMTWMASNCVVSRRIDGTILPKKESEMSANKIDGIDAGLNALAPAMDVTPPEVDIMALVA